MKDKSWAKRVSYDLSRIAARLVGVVTCQIRCEGRELVPPRGGALVCANHQSYLDPVLIGLACDRRLNYLARQTLFRFAPFRWLIQWYDAIPIERDGLGIAGLKETLRRLRRGELVLVFPEGTRTKDGRIAALRPGFIALARRGKVPVVPVALEGAFQTWPRSQKLPCPHRIWIQFGRPITVDEMANMSDDELIERLTRELHRCHATACRRLQSHPAAVLGATRNRPPEVTQPPQTNPPAA